MRVAERTRFGDDGDAVPSSAAQDRSEARRERCGLGPPGWSLRATGRRCGGFPRRRRSASRAGRASGSAGRCAGRCDRRRPDARCPAGRSKLDQRNAGGGEAARDGFDTGRARPLDRFVQCGSQAASWARVADWSDPNRPRIGRGSGGSAGAVTPAASACAKPPVPLQRTGWGQRPDSRDNPAEVVVGFRVEYADPRLERGFEPSGLGVDAMRAQRGDEIVAGGTPVAVRPVWRIACRRG